MIAKMVRQFDLPIEIIAAETIRDASGLALSSRNGYLSEQQRLEAVQLRTRRCDTWRGKCAPGAPTGGSWRNRQPSACGHAAGSPDYVAIRRQADLGPPAQRAPMVVLGAAKLGGTRLIDAEDV